MTTTGARLAQRSLLPTGTAIDHLLTLSEGGGGSDVVRFASLLRVRIDWPEIRLSTISAPSHFIELPKQEATSADSSDESAWVRKQNSVFHVMNGRNGLAIRKTPAETLFVSEV